VEKTSSSRIAQKGTIGTPVSLLKRQDQQVTGT